MYRDFNEIHDINNCIVKPIRKATNDKVAAVKELAGRMCKSIVILLLNGDKGFIFPDIKSTRK